MILLPEKETHILYKAVGLPNMSVALIDIEINSRLAILGWRL